MIVYKRAITANNNENLRDKFFNTKIIQSIWKKLVPKMKLKDFFKEEANERISPTYSEISGIMDKRYKL